LCIVCARGSTVHLLYRGVGISGISVCRHGRKQQGGFAFIGIAGMLESDEFLEKLADFDDSKLSYR
jgi:hypothetical protein